MATDQHYDLLVVGGGIHGVGVAQAGAAAGYRVLLVEQRELAAGTSSRSSKLIHGGLRYLESYQFSLVRESLRERELLLKLAPDLVHRQPFLIPVYPQTSRRPGLLRIGLLAYWVLAGLRPQTGFTTLPRARWSDLDGLQTHGLQHVFQYWDAQTDDRRLTQAVMASAQSLGAELACPAEFVSAQVTPTECRCLLRLADQPLSVTAAVVVNAAGPWATRVADRITPRPPTPPVDLVAGTHLELPGQILHGCYYLEAPQDGRAVFVMPWYDRTLVGTTERAHAGDPAELLPTASEVDYLLAVFRHYFPQRSTEVLAQWAGLRVLPAGAGSAFSRPRETQLPVDHPLRPRVLSVFGGKLTGYRATAEKIIRKLRPSLPPARPVADTRSLPLRAPQP